MFLLLCVSFTSNLKWHQPNAECAFTSQWERLYWASPTNQQTNKMLYTSPVTDLLTMSLSLKLINRLGRQLTIGVVANLSIYVTHRLHIAYMNGDSCYLTGYACNDRHFPLRLSISLHFTTVRRCCTLSHCVSLVSVVRECRWVGSRVCFFIVGWWGRIRNSCISDTSGTCAQRPIREQRACDVWGKRRREIVLRFGRRRVTAPTTGREEQK